MKKIIKTSLLLVVTIILLIILSSNLKANADEMVINFSKIGEEKVVQILLSKDDDDRKVTKEEIMTKNNTIISIKDKTGNEIENSEILKTGYTLETANGTSTIILLGDANEDGYVCDTDDIMVIIDDYLGKVEANYITKTAANLYNNDDVLDTDDVMQMINMYLGKLEGQLLTTPIDDNIEETENPPEEEQSQMCNVSFDVGYVTNINDSTFDIYQEGEMITNGPIFVGTEIYGYNAYAPGIICLSGKYENIYDKVFSFNGTIEVKQNGITNIMIGLDNLGYIKGTLECEYNETEGVTALKLTITDKYIADDSKTFTVEVVNNVLIHIDIDNR